MRKMKNEIDLYNRKLHKIVYDQINKITENQKSLIYALAKLLGASSEKKGKHLENTCANCRILSISLQLSPKFVHEISDSFIDTIDLAASLHDIGKMSIYHKSLLIEEKLNYDEMEISKTHAEVGANILRGIYSYDEQNEFLKMAIDIAYYHHEKWNGKGYPKGLLGKEIPLAARIMSVIDAYDTLTNERCIKQPYTTEEIHRIMNEESGKSFDPDIIEVFNKIEKQLKTGDENTED
jgi:putative two-component system response regulator